MVSSLFKELEEKQLTNSYIMNTHGFTNEHILIKRRYFEKYLTFKFTASLQVFLKYYYLMSGVQSF